MHPVTQVFLKGGRFIVMLLLFLSLGIAALWNLQIDDIVLSEIWEQSNGLYFLSALLLISLSMPFVALRWRSFFPVEVKKDSSALMLTGFLAAAFVLNLALPGPVGEALSAGMAQRKYKISFSHALASLGLSRILGLASACGISGLVYWFAPFEIDPKWSFTLQSAAVFLVLSSSVLVAIAFLPQKTADVLNSIPHPKVLNPLWRIADQFLNALQETLDLGWKSYGESFFWAVLGHTMVALGIYVATIAIGIEASWSAILFTYAASIAASIVMFLLPGSSVGWDLLFATTLSATTNMHLLEAGAITAIIRIQQLLVALLGAGVIWSVAGELLQSAMEDAQRAESQ